MNETQEVKELLSGISSKDVAEILQEGDEENLTKLEKRFKQHTKSARGEYFAAKIFEIKFKDKIICKWGEESIIKFAKLRYYGTDKYGLEMGSLHDYVGDIPEEHEDMIEQLNGFKKKYKVGYLQVIADSMRFAKDPYLLFDINNVYYVMGKWGEDIKIVEEEQMPTKKRWFK